MPVAASSKRAPAPPASAPLHPAIAADALRKAFSEHVVLDGLSFTVEAGTVFALLGSNGSGKTTTVSILATLLDADAGRATVAGHDVAGDPDAVRDAIGVTGQFSSVDDLLTGRENLRLMTDLHHLERAEAGEQIDDLLDRFELGDAADRPASTYSGGMRRRLDLAMTLIGSPAVIFLDEPTTGLDPRSRREMWEIVRGLVSDGTTVFLTTQYLEEADQLADRVAILDDGRLVAHGTPAELKALVPGGYLGLTFADPADARRAATALGVPAPEASSVELQIPADTGVAGVRRTLLQLEQAGLEPASLAVHTPDLDDVFLSLTGRGASGTEDEEVPA